MIRPVSYAAILDDPNWPALLAEYAAECSIPELGSPDPQRDLYELLEKSGGLQAFGVYEVYPGSEFLVGFAILLTYVLPHYGKKIATTESIFMSRRCRGGMGVQLLAFIEAQARTNGAEDFLPSAPVGSRFDRMLAASKHYRHTNNVYLRSLA